MYTILSVVCEVEMDTGVIVAAEFTVATDLAKDYLNRLMAGRSLLEEEDAIVAELVRCYFSGTQKALIQAFRDMAKRYRAQAGAGGPAERPARRPTDRPPAARPAPFAPLPRRSDIAAPRSPVLGLPFHS